MINIDITTKSKKWLEIKNIENFIEETCQKIIPLTNLKEILKKDFTLEISISLLSNPQIKKINSQYRSKNKATNVLSFPSLNEKLIRKNGLKNTVGAANYLFLGDILLAFETIKKESLAQKKEICDHLCHLILHSILHLIGFDHEDEKMAKIMEDLEIKILKKIGIKNPYQY